MTSAALLDVLHAAGVVLTLDGHALRYRAPKGVLTSDLLLQLAQHKAALLALVEDFEERTALAEYDGGLPRAEAERLAWVYLRGEVQP
jgi:hypothetical protein